MIKMEKKVLKSHFLFEEWSIKDRISLRNKIVKSKKNKGQVILEHMALDNLFKVRRRFNRPN